MKFNHYSIGNITLKPKEHKTYPMPTEKDAKRIMEILRDAPDIECQVLLALTCSLRQSEIAAISVEDVHDSQIYIHGAIVLGENNKYVYKPTNKSDAGTRTIDMPKYLEERIAVRCKEIGHGYLFSTNPNTLLSKFKTLLKANGLPEYNMHSLRHCFAAMLHARGVPDKYVMEMGGWGSNYVLKDIYQYTFDEETSKFKRETNKYFENILEKKSQDK